MVGVKNSEALIETLKAVLMPREEIVAAYLYGSFAKGVARAYSDVDVAVLLDKAVPEKDYPYGYRSELMADIMKALHTNHVDLVVTNNASPFLMYQIVRYGTLIFSRSEAQRIAFQVKAIAKYNDTKRLLDIQSRYLSKRLKSGTYGKT